MDSGLRQPLLPSLDFIYLAQPALSGNEIRGGFQADHVVARYVVGGFKKQLSERVYSDWNWSRYLLNIFKGYLYEEILFHGLSIL